MSRSLRRRSQRAQKSHRNSVEAPNLIEKLEQKQLLVGQIQAVVRGDSLYITGDHSANQIDISFHEGNVAVRPKTGTRINGERGQFVAFEGTDTVPGSIFVNMRQGDDTVILSGGVKVQKDVWAAGHDGDDTLALDNAIVRDDVIFVGGDGNDSVSLSGSRVVDDLDVEMHGGDDLIRVVNSEVRGDLRFRGHEGADSVVFDNADVTRNTVLLLHGGDDAVDIQNSRFEQAVHMRADAGDDSVLIDDSSFEGPVGLNLGSGDDDLALGDGDGSDTTPAVGNVFKNTFTTTGRGGVDGIDVDVDGEFRSARRESGFESDAFNGDTSGAITAADDVAAAVLGFIDVELTARIQAAGDNTLVFGTDLDRLVTTMNDTVTVTGTTDGGATLEFDTDGDGVFDNVIGTADRDGTYSIEVPLILDSLHTIDVRNANQVGETRSLRVQNVTGTIVRMSTSLGDIDIELADNDTPNTVANFLGYFDEYGDNMFVHRIIADQFVQAGGFTIAGETVSEVVTGDPIDSEFDAIRPNVEGTISTALVGGNADSATSQWFFNVTDNPAQDNDQHTVFGAVIGAEFGTGMDVIRAINSLTSFDLVAETGETALTDTPLENFTEDSDLTGTVSATSGDAAVTGTGTQFETELTVGDQVTVGTQIFEVDSIASDTEFTATTVAAQDLTDEVASVENTVSEENYVVFSNLEFLNDIANL